MIPKLPAYVQAFGAPPLLVLLLAMAALWVARKRRVSYRSALAGALRQTLPAALAVLAVIWVGAAVVAVREGGIYVRNQTRAYEVGTLLMLQEIGNRK